MSTKIKETVGKIGSLALVIMWMILVFCYSNQPGNDSSDTSKNVTTKVINILTTNTNIKYEDKIEIINKIDPIIRKMAHYSVYMLGGIILMNYINSAYKTSENKKVLISILIGMCYAAADEFHQLFIEGRSGRIVDIYIDTLGVITGVSIFLLLSKIRINLKRTNKGEINEKGI
ncbi:VanZ like family protein [compost metagenome]